MNRRRFESVAKTDAYSPRGIAKLFALKPSSSYPSQMSLQKLRSLVPRYVLGIDEIQCFKLGLVVGKRVWNVHHTSNGKDSKSNPLVVDSDPDCFRWKEPVELVERILQVARTRD